MTVRSDLIADIATIDNGLKACRQLVAWLTRENAMHASAQQDAVRISMELDAERFVLCQRLADLDKPVVTPPATS